MSETSRSPLKEGRVRLISDESAFRDAFARFEDYTPIGWSEAKHACRGQESTIICLFDDDEDRFMTLEFDDGYEDDFPYEVVQTQLSVWGTAEKNRHFVLRMLHGLLERLEAEKEIDVFDIVALEPVVPANFLAGNRSRAIICTLAQVLVPLLTGAFLVYDIVLPVRGGKMQFRALCNVTQGWDDAFLKITNKIVGVMLLLYMYNLLESRLYMWLCKPTYELLSRGMVFRIMPLPVWCAVGLILNAFALSACGLVSVIVIYYSSNPLEIVLNSFALFFLVDIDDLLVDKHDFRRSRDRVRSELRRYQGNLNLSIATTLIGFEPALAVAYKLISFVKIIVLLAPMYIIVCK